MPTRTLDPALQELLRGRYIATFGTENSDGSIHLTAVTPGASLQVTLTAINRSQFPLTWLGSATTLGYNQVRTRSLPLTIPADQAYSQPFWLAKPKTGSAYTIDHQEMREKPDNPPFYVGTFEIQAGSERIELQRPLQYRYVDPERGEMLRPVSIVPPVAVNLAEACSFFPAANRNRCRRR